MIKLYKCYTCKHYIKDPESADYICKAFPNGIPREIFDEKVDHVKPYPGDHGFQYELADRFK